LGVRQTVPPTLPPTRERERKREKMSGERKARKTRNRRGVTDRWNKIRYRAYAPVYDLLAKPLEGGRRRAIERLGIGSDDRVLILGCGTGMDLEYLPDGTEVVAMDLTPSMVRRTEQRAERLELEVDAQVGDAQALPFEDDSFDAVLLHLVLSVVPEPHSVVAETGRVVASDGLVSVYDKFVPESEEPSLIRRAVNPVARLLFADLNNRLEPMVRGTPLETGEKEEFLGGMYTVTIARPTTR